MAQANYSINTDAFLMGVIANIERDIGRELTDTEENDVLDFITNNIPQHYFSKFTKTQIGSVVSNDAITSLQLASNTEIVDTHEMLKRNLSDTPIEEQRAIKKDAANNVEVNVDNILGVRDIPTLVKQLKQPKSSVNTVYLLLDTRYRTLESGGEMTLKWGHINSLVRSQGTVNSIGNIRDIIGLKLMPFRLPNTASTNTYYKKISVLIEELSPQSIIAHEDRRYHFMCKVAVINTDVIEADPDHFFKREYKFNKPITSLNTITLSLGSPLEPVVLDPDRITASITAYASPTTIVFDANHNISTSDTIYIENFTTANPSFDGALIESMNNTAGNAVIVTTPTTVTIAVDSSSIIAAVAGTVTAPSTALAGTITATTNSTAVVGIGTNFLVDFVVGDYIDIVGSPSAVYQVASIANATNMTITSVYTQTSGTFGYRVTGTALVGAGTDFQTTLSVGDNIIIADGGSSPEFIVSAIQSNTSLTLATPYTGLDGAGFTVSKDNSVDTPLRIFLGSKRIFFTLEATYLSS